VKGAGGHRSACAIPVKRLHPQICVHRPPCAETAYRLQSQRSMSNTKGTKAVIPSSGLCIVMAAAPGC
jgi:hypothetical protein